MMRSVFQVESKHYNLKMHNIINLFKTSSVHACFNPNVLAIGDRTSVHFILGVFFEIIIHAVVDFAYSLKLYLSCLFHSLE